MVQSETSYSIYDGVKSGGLHFSFVSGHDLAFGLIIAVCAAV